MDRLDKAIADFEDESSDLSLGERVSGLRQALLWNAFDAIKKIKRNGKSVASEEESFKQEECMKYFKDIERMYTSEVRNNKLSGKSNDIMNKEFLTKIKEMKGSIGDIVRDITPISNGK